MRDILSLDFFFNEKVATNLTSKTGVALCTATLVLLFFARKNELLTRMSSKVPTSFKVEYIKRKWIEHRLNIKHF